MASGELLVRARQALGIAAVAMGLPDATFAQATQPRVERVHFNNGPVTLAGTLMSPGAKSSGQAVVIVHGSGPNEGNAYRVYAQHFVAAGIAALVYDKRGSGESSGDWRYRTLDDLAGDARAAVAFLRTRTGVDASQVGVWGISQGSWVIARLAAHDSNVAFVIGVATDGVSPTQQEMYHKDQIFRSLGYRNDARESAIKFWRLIFDWLVLVADGSFPVPKGFMESQLSGAYFGLAYDPIPDWQRLRQPILLIYGEQDRLTPVRPSIERLCKAFAPLGQTAHSDATIVVVPGAVHNITLGTNGLEFAWDSGFAPGYFELMNNWVKAHAGKGVMQGSRPACSEGLTPAKLGDHLADPLSWIGRAIPQLALVSVFVVVFAVGVVAWLVSLFRAPLPHVIGVLSLANLLLLGGFVKVIIDSFFPQGMSYHAGSTLSPLWKALPPLGDVSAVLTIVAVASCVRLMPLGVRRRTLAIVVTTVAVLFVPWLWYWELIGW